MTPARLRLAAVLTACLLITAACSGAKSPEDAAKSVSAGEQPTTDSGIDPDAAATDGSDPAGPSGTVKGATSTGKKSTKPGATTNGTAPQAPPLPAPPGFVPSSLFNAGEDRTGMTDNSIAMCAHAALTYGPAFNTSADDLNVYWTARNEKGGVHGRRVSVTYENDDYKPDTAVTAAKACEAKKIFMLLGGIGFDQIPAVRNWAESARMLYLHHTATVNGSGGKKFSYTSLPSTERMGEMFGELAMTRFKGKKIGIISRDSDNWSPGVDAFRKVVGNQVTIVGEEKVQGSKGYYVQELRNLQTKGAEVVWLWENALAATEIVKQSKAQAWSPTFMVFPFNLTSQTLGDDALNPKMYGVAMFSAYSFRDYSGSFAAYADDMKEFEAQYAKHRSSVDLSGVAGDLLFLNWQAQKSMAKLLDICGRDCGRNRFIDVLRTYKGRPTSSACDINFPGDSHLGATAVNITETYKTGDGKVNWRNINTCADKL
ncbi:MAG: ABC transporter substrate-binding protein [Acidimicrobiales bacterium]